MIKLKFFALFLILSYAIGPVTFAQTAESSPHQKFLGNWSNIDPAGDLVKVQVFKQKDGKHWQIQAWGKCEPKNCDWGKVTLNLVGSSISDKSFEYGFAVWEFEGRSKVDMTTYLLLKIDGEQLVIEKITIFSDGSKRSNYRSFYLLKREK
ncbi:MAG: hypothetical protein DWQ05_01060 [Calditrichaeota bacterium]|nr:MAG: hypothetical protein DWQ05_01060 [Calditrichota bacterium]